MLVLKRKPGQRVILRLDGVLICTLEVVDSSRYASRLGFTAPANVEIMREEVDQRNERDSSTGYDTDDGSDGANDSDGPTPRLYRPDREANQKLQTLPAH